MIHNVSYKPVPYSFFLKTPMLFSVPARLFVAVAGQIWLFGKLAIKYPWVGLLYLAAAIKTFIDYTSLYSLTGNIGRFNLWAKAFMSSFVPGYQFAVYYSSISAASIASIGKHAVLYIAPSMEKYLSANPKLVQSVLMHEAGHLVGPFAWLLPVGVLLNDINLLLLIGSAFAVPASFIYHAYKGLGWYEAGSKSLELAWDFGSTIVIARVLFGTMWQGLEYCADIFSVYNGGSPATSLAKVAPEVTFGNDWLGQLRSGLHYTATSLFSTHPANADRIWLENSVKSVLSMR